MKKETGGRLRRVSQTQRDRFHFVSLWKAELLEPFRKLPLQRVATCGAAKPADAAANHEWGDEFPDWRFLTACHRGTCRLRQFVRAWRGFPTQPSQRDREAIRFDHIGQRDYEPAQAHAGSELDEHDQRRLLEIER